MATSEQGKSRRAATLADVGKAAGVSAMAASAVLNGTKTSARISLATRKRIEAAAAELKYRPNVAARALANRRMNTIGVAVVVDRGELNNYFLDVFNGIIDGAAQFEQNATVFTLHNWADSIEQLRRFSDGRIDGMILVAPVVDERFEHALPAHTPYVALHANMEIGGVVNLESDEEEGAHAIVQKLIEAGHRRIMHISGPRGLIGAERRILGFQRALDEAGLPFEALLMPEAGSFSAHSGRELMEDWLGEHAGEPMPTAIFCANDSLGVGCMEALAAVGLRVPEDVSICGFDDSHVARTTVPQLATVRQPLRRMGRDAVELLLKRIDAYANDSGKAPASPVVFQTRVIMRGSVGAPKEGVCAPEVVSSDT